MTCEEVPETVFSMFYPKYFLSFIIFFFTSNYIIELVIVSTGVASLHSMTLGSWGLRNLIVEVLGAKNPNCAASRG